MKMKKAARVLLALAMIALMPIQAFAANESVTESRGAARANASATLSDSKGNKYSMSATSVRYTKGGKSCTSFVTSYYYDGTPSSVNGYKKTISVSGAATLSGGGVNNMGTKSDTFSGASGSVTVSVDDLLYRVTAVTGTHKMSTNKESTTKYSYQ